MVKKLTTLFILICMMGMFSACNNKIEKDNYRSTNAENVQGKIKIMVSFNAMRELTEAVGKDKVEVKTMIPAGTEPHDFEPRAKNIESLYNSNIFIYNGFGMEPWADKTIEAAGNKDLVSVDASMGFDPIKSTDTGQVKEHGQYDPHLWLSLKGAETQAKNIKNALIKVDPSSKDYYEKNYQDFTDKLEALNNSYVEKFKTISNKNFVTGHAAFAYLCRDFGLKQNSVEDVFAEGEPSAKKMKDLIEYCKQNNIKTIFVEDMISSKVSDTLAKEVGAKVEKISTVESSEANKNYIQMMTENLEKIYNSLK
jgi:zinc transport system substrate-binding protein